MVTRFWTKEKKYVSDQSFVASDLWQHLYVTHKNEIFLAWLTFGALCQIKTNYVCYMQATFPLFLLANNGLAVVCGNKSWNQEYIDKNAVFIVLWLMKDANSPKKTKNS